MTSGRNKRIYLSSGSVKFGDLFNNRTVINDGWIEVTTPDNLTYRHRVDDFAEDGFGEPIAWAHRGKCGFSGTLTFVDEVFESFGIQGLSGESRVMNMSKQDAIRANPNRITMSMDDMLDMLTESEEQNNGTV